MSKYTTGAGKRWSDRTPEQQKEALSYARETLPWREKGLIPDVGEKPTLKIGNPISTDHILPIFLEGIENSTLQELRQEYGQAFVSHIVMKGKIALLLSDKEVKTTFTNGEGVDVDYALLALGIQPTKIEHHYLTNNTQCVYHFSQEQMEKLSQEKVRLETANQKQTFVEKLNNPSEQVSQGFSANL